MPDQPIETDQTDSLETSQPDGGLIAPAVPLLERLDLRAEVLNRTLIRLSLPAIAESLMLSAVFFADTLIVGWLRDDSALAAVALAGTLTWLFNAPFYALAVSATSLVARSWGEQDAHKARCFAGQSIAISFLFSLAVMAIGIPPAARLVHWMGGSPEVVELGAVYLRITLLSALLGMPMMVSNGAIRGTGDTKTPMRNTLIMNLVNILASCLLAFDAGPLPGLGVAGVAWGTTIARTLGGFLSLRHLIIRRYGIAVPWKTLVGWNPVYVRPIFHLSNPAMVERIISNGAHVIFMWIVALLGTTALAAHNIALRVESLAFMPGFGVSVAVTAIVGQAIGARQPHIAEVAVQRTLLWTGLAMACLGATFVLFAQHVVVIFGSTPEVLRLAGIALQISALEHPLMAFAMILSGSLRGAGDTRSPLYVSLVCIVLFRFFIVYFFAITLGWGLPGVWLGTAVDWAGRSIGLWWVFKRGVWKLIHERQAGRV